MAKKVQITRSWIVYPPNYKPGDGYKKVRFLKRAWNIACAMGKGAQVHSHIKKVGHHHHSLSYNEIVYVVGE